MLYISKAVNEDGDHKVCAKLELAPFLSQYDTALRALMTATKEATHIPSVKATRENAKKVIASKGEIQEELYATLGLQFPMTSDRIFVAADGTVDEWLQEDMSGVDPGDKS